jgi:hypothetical protein
MSLKPNQIQRFNIRFSEPVAPENVRIIMTKSGPNGTVEDVEVNQAFDESGLTLTVTTQLAITPSTTYHLIIESLTGGLVSDTTYKSLAN